MIERIVVVTRKTALQDLVLRMNTKAQAKFYLEQNRVSFTEYEASDRQYQDVLNRIERSLQRGQKHQLIDRELLPTFQFRESDLVVTVGQDGLVVNVAKYLTEQPILAINPDPERIDGILIPFQHEELEPMLGRALEGRVRITPVSMAQAELQDGQTLIAVNDLFVGPRSHGSARYEIELANRRERQSSSGVIVSTGAGCTGWLRSITAGAWGIARHFERQLGREPPATESFALGWDSEELWFTVREPFPSKTSQASMVFGTIPAGEPLVVTSHMPEGGVIFSDGIEQDYLAFNSGAIATIRIAPRKAHLIVRG